MALLEFKFFYINLNFVNHFLDHSNNFAFLYSSIIYPCENINSLGFLVKSSKAVNSGFLIEYLGKNY